MNKEKNLNANIDVLCLISDIARLIFIDYFRFYTRGYLIDKPSNRVINKGIVDTVDNYLSIISGAVSLPCPECHKLIPLNIDKEIISQMLISWVDCKGNHISLDFPSIDEIQDEIRKYASAHPIKCNNIHLTKCKFSDSKFVSLEDLL